MSEIVIEVKGLDELRINIEKYDKKVRDQIDNAVQLGALKILRDAKILAPVDTGRLRNSIHYNKTGEAEAQVSTDVEYACILGSNTMINCGKGKLKRIGDIKAGCDEVLTQDGMLHKVISTLRFSSKNKPNLIKITTEYRKDRVHKLIVTIDHKILVSRNNCNQWIAAKDLKIGDLVYTPIKKSYTIKTAKRIKKVCKICGKEKEYREREIVKYRRGETCSIKCSNKSRINAHIGSKRTLESKLKMSLAAKQKFAKNPELHPNRILNKKGFQTNAEKMVEMWLLTLGVKFEKQKQIGRHFVDFYLPEKNIVIEADGAFWHKDQTKDTERDKEILCDSQEIKAIFHLHFVDKRFSKNIQYNPLSNVYYIQCNNTMNSFVDATMFKKVKILNLEKFVYVPKLHGHYPKLYDLTVEGMHSFVASGILISNSHVEFGTSKQRAQPYMRPAAEQNAPEIIDAIKTAVKNAKP